MTSDQHICKSCGNTFHGIFCNLCGEKVIEHKDRKIDSSLINVLIATTIADNKFIKNLRLIVTRPGFLSREYVEGRRVKYMRPLQMFFILNLIYFLFPILQMFNSTLYTQMHMLPHSRIAREVIARKMVHEHLSYRAIELMYNDKTTNLAKMLIVVFVVLGSLPLALIFAKKNRYFSDHLALSIELTSFNIAINAIGLSMLFGVLSQIVHLTHMDSGHYLNDAALTVVFIATNLYFIFTAARTFYNQKGKRLVFKALGGILGLFLALEAYRFILFFITIWTV